jgi:hypothetical protein
MITPSSTGKTSTTTPYYNRTKWRRLHQDSSAATIAIQSFLFFFSNHRLKRSKFCGIRLSKPMNKYAINVEHALHSVKMGGGSGFEQESPPGKTQPKQLADCVSMCSFSGSCCFLGFQEKRLQPLRKRSPKLPIAQK